MKLRFNPEAKVIEYANGPVYFKNEGQPIEVNKSLAETLLTATHRTESGDFVKVFEKVEDDSPSRTVKPKKTAEEIQ